MQYDGIVALFSLRLINQLQLLAMSLESYSVYKKLSTSRNGKNHINYYFELVSSNNDENLSGKSNSTTIGNEIFEFKSKKKIKKG